MTTPDLICIGAIMGAFGVKGEVRIKSFCAIPAAIDNYGTLSDQDGAPAFDLSITRPIKAGFAARIKGIHTKDQADALKGSRLYVARDALPRLPDDEYYHADLIGLDVVDTGGKLIGKIAAVYDHGAGDLLEIDGPALKGGILLPFTRDAVPTVDISARRIVADPPDGLLPDEV